MKNLKRNFIKLFGIVFCIILLTGCNYQNKIEKISNNMKNINSYTVSVQTEYDISGKKTLNTVTDIDLNNKIAKTKNNVLGNSNDDKFEIYYQYESDKIITYTYGIFGDFYFKQESEYTDEDKIGKLNYIEFLNNLENIEVNKIKSDKKGFKKYNLTIESSYISDLIINFNNVKFLEGDVSITVYTDKNYIREVDYDFSNIIDGDNNSYKMIVKYDNINDISLKISDDIINNSKTFDENDFNINMNLIG